MDIASIFSELLSHMRLGLTIHNDFAAIYGFLNLCGYQRCQEYHYYEESKSYRDLQNFYTTQYNQIARIEELPAREIIPSNWFKHTKFDVDISTKKNGVEEVLRKWLEWEQETEKLLISKYKILYELNELVAVQKLTELIKDVNEEISYIKNEQLNLAAINFDLSIIVPEQETLYAEFSEKIKELRG